MSNWKHNSAKKIALASPDKEEPRFQGINGGDLVMLLADENEYKVVGRYISYRDGKTPMLILDRKDWTNAKGHLSGVHSVEEVIKLQPITRSKK